MSNPSATRSNSAVHTGSPLAGRDLKLLAPYLPEGSIPPNAKTHGNLHFWEVKEGKQSTKYAVGVLDHPDTPKDARNLQAQRANSRGTGYDAGHLIGHQFGGPEILENLSLQNPTMNQEAGNWYKLESQWAKDLREQNRVAVVIKEVSHSDTPNFLNRSVDSLTIDHDGRVKHNELSTLNPETERALAAQSRGSAEEPSRDAEILDLRAALARQDQLEEDALEAAQERLESLSADPTKEAPASRFDRVVAQLQNWRGRSQGNEIKAATDKEPEVEVFGTLGNPSQAKLDAGRPKSPTHAAAVENLQKLGTGRQIPGLDKVTVVADAKTGELTYNLSGKPALIDKGQTITVLKPDQAATRIALEMAVHKYGRSVEATGTQAFQQQLIAAAVQMREDVVFTDTKLQSRFVEAKAEQNKQEEKKTLAAQQFLGSRIPTASEKDKAQEQPLADGSRGKGIAAATEAAAAGRDPERAFLRHAHALRERYGYGLDNEKGDGLVALKMAQSGWKPEEIASALKRWKLNEDILAPQEIDAYAKKLTLQAVGRVAKEAGLQRGNQMELGR